MENQMKQAVDDLSMIKNMIDRTRKSFAGFSKIFVMWGILYFIMGIYTFLASMNMELTMSVYSAFPALTYILQFGIFIVGGLIFLGVTKKQPLLGLERHLMILWILVLVMQLIRMRVTVSVGEQVNYTVIATSNFAFIVYMIGTALIMTGIMTDLKNFKVLGVVYIVAAFVHSYVNVQVVYKSMDIVGMFILPFTLIYTGVYLKRYHERGVKDGSELDS